MDDDETLRRIIKEAVHETLAGLGFNVQNLYEVQADMQYLRKVRRQSEEVINRIHLSIITVSVPAVLYVAWNAFKKAVGGG